MNLFMRYLALLLIIEIVILAAGKYLAGALPPAISFLSVVTASLFFMLNTALVLKIFFRGRTRSADSQTMHTLVAISLKFLIELIFAFIWIFILKKRDDDSLILFFVLYLTFTLYTVSVILKTLNNKSL
jgi:FtsH-binding integral membrane protein